MTRRTRGPCWNATPASTTKPTASRSAFDRIRDLASALGYAPDVKLYRQNPDGYKGHVGDVSAVLRVAVTGRESSPDLFEVMRILGRGRVLGRLRRALDALAQG